MMRFPSLLCAVVVVSLVLGCDTSEPRLATVSPNVLKEGASWTYNLRFLQSPLDSSAADTTLDTTLRMQVTKTGVEIGNRRDLFELELFEPSKPDKIERNWYQQSPDSLVEIAYASLAVPGTPLSSAAGAHPDHPSLGLLGLPHLVRRQLARSDRRLATAAPDTTLRSDARLILQAPLEKDASWTAFRDPFLTRRTVTGRQSVETPAGQFETIEVENLMFTSSDTLQWLDYYSDEGLVRRTITDTLRRRNEEGEVIGKFVRWEVYTLTDRQE